MHVIFYDAHCEALRRLLHALSPAQVTVLVQERRTSADPAALAFGRPVLAMSPTLPGYPRVGGHDPLTMDTP